MDEMIVTQQPESTTFLQDRSGYVITPLWWVIIQYYVSQHKEEPEAVADVLAIWYKRSVHGCAVAGNHYNQSGRDDRFGYALTNRELMTH